MFEKHLWKSDILSTNAGHQPASLLKMSLFSKNEKQGKYLPILHEATCDNYFIVKGLFYLNKIYQELSYLLIVSGLLNII